MSTHDYAPLIQKLDVVAKRAPAGQRPELAVSVVLLFTAVRNCHSAYLRVKAGRGDHSDEETRHEWYESIEMMNLALGNLGTTLSIFAPDLFSMVSSYLGVEAAAYDRHLSSDESLQSLGVALMEDIGTGANYTDVIAVLGTFIRETFTMEEIYSAAPDKG